MLPWACSCSSPGGASSLASLSCALVMPTPPVQMSQASPIRSPSPSACPKLESIGQLSQASPRLSKSTSLWSGSDRAVVATVADAVAVAVDLCRIREERADVVRAAVEWEARVTEAVAVAVGAGVAGVADRVEIAVGLGRIHVERAVVADVADHVAVAIAVRAGREWAVVGPWTDARREVRIAEAVPVELGAGVAGVAEAVAVGVFLTGIEGAGTVVAASHAVSVRINERQERTRVRELLETRHVVRGGEAERARGQEDGRRRAAEQREQSAWTRADDDPEGRRPRR